MSPLTLLLLGFAGVGSGLIGYLTGLASLVSYPALLAAGLPPVTANATNTVGVVGIGIGSSSRSVALFGSRDRGRLVRDMAIAFAGGLAGSVLLLLGGNSIFSAVVPWLIGLASLALLVSPRLRALRGDIDSPLSMAVALFALCVYGGYFGAGAGVMYLAAMLILSRDDLATSLVMKSLLLAVANITASLMFIITGHVDWPAAIVMGIGSFVGGFLGPTVQRWIPDRVLRIGVALCGFGLAIWLALR